jgi:hypothetical protein
MGANLQNQKMENPAPGPRGAFENDLLGSSASVEYSQNNEFSQDCFDYLLAECRCASMRLRLQLIEVDTVGLALKAGLISGDMAIESLREIGAPIFVCGTPFDGGDQ